MTRGRRRDTSRGPQFKTLHRDVKVKEWAKVIQTTLRHYTGDALVEGETLYYAEQFWRSLEKQETPITDIVATPGSEAATWVLAKHCKVLVPSGDKETLVQKPEPKRGSEIYIGIKGVETSVYPIIGYNTFSTGDDDPHTDPVLVELEIDHTLLLTLVEQVSRAKNQVLTEGPFTVRVLKEKALIVTADMHIEGVE